VGVIGVVISFLARQLILGKLKYWPEFVLSINPFAYFFYHWHLYYQEDLVWRRIQ